MSLNYSKAIQPSAPGSARTIFDGPGQRVACDPAKIRLLSDRVLVKDLPQDDSRYGLLVLPETAQHGGVGKQGNLRIGVVIAVGEGDRYLEAGLDAQGSVRRKLITATCPTCEGDGQMVSFANYVYDHDSQGLEQVEYVACKECEGGRVPVVIPPQCKVGDLCLYDRRRSEEVIINGDRFQLSHAEQSVLGVLDAE